MGGKVVDAPGEEVVGEVLHRPHTGVPAVGPEVFAEGPAALAGVDVGVGGPQLAQLIVVELPVAGLGKALRPDRVAAADHHLAADVVDAGHMLPGEAPEVVAHAGAEPGVGAVVLNDVADILDPVGGAPVPQLIGKALFHQPGDAVHIPFPDLRVRPPVVQIRPEDRQKVLPVISQPLTHHLRHIPAPGERHVLMPDPLVEVVADGVADAGLVREEPGDDRPEEVLVTGVMGFIDRLDLEGAGGVVQHVDVVLPAAAVVGEVEGVDLPVPVRHRPVELAVLHPVGQFNKLCHRVFRPGLPGDQVEEAVVVENLFIFPPVEKAEGGHFKRMDQFIDVDLHLPLGAADVGSGEAEVLLPEGDVRLVHRPGGVSGGEVGVVEDPDLHPLFPRLIQQDVQVVPPAGPGEIRVGPCLEADRPASGVVDDADVFPERRLVLAVLPHEGEDVVFAPAFQKRLYPFILHNVLPFGFRFWITMVELISSYHIE